MNKNNVGPTHQIIGDRIEVLPYPGSLRDHFAGLAMQGLLANEDARLMAFDECSRVAYEHADAMLRAREEKSP